MEQTGGQATNSAGLKLRSSWERAGMFTPRLLNCNPVTNSVIFTTVHTDCQAAGVSRGGRIAQSKAHSHVRRSQVLCELSRAVTKGESQWPNPNDPIRKYLQPALWFLRIS